MRSWIVRALFAACAVIVSGCTLVERIGEMTSPGGKPAVPSVSELQTQVDWGEPGDGSQSSQDGEFRPAMNRKSPVPRPKTKPEIIDPRTFVGLDKHAVEQMLGSPHHITLAQPATVWAWEQDGCRMRLFFYPDLSADKFRALTYEISADQPKKNAMLIETCASRIKWANAETPR